MNERRRDRLATLLKEELPHFFVEECDLPTGSFVSVLYVEVLESGTRANIFVSIFPDTEKERVAKKLKISENKATHFVRQRIRSKYSPSIHFFLAASPLQLEEGESL